MGGAASSLCMSAKNVATLAVPDFGLGSHDDEDPDVRDDDRSSSAARDMLRRFSTLVSPVTVERLGSHNINFLRADRLSEQRSLPSQFRRTTSFTPPIEGASRRAMLHARMPVRSVLMCNRQRPCFFVRCLLRVRAGIMYAHGLFGHASHVLDMHALLFSHWTRARPAHNT